LTIATGTTLELGAELSLDKLGLKAKLGTKTTYKHETKFAYELPGGHSYLAGLYAGFPPAYIWTLDG
jgi:hypothetical protein